jgi:hypothetical protein
MHKHNEKLARVSWEWMNEALKHLDTIHDLATQEMKSAVSLNDKLEADSYRKAAAAGRRAVIAVFTSERHVSEPRKR